MNAKRQLTGAPLIGRRIGIAAFWCMAVFVTTASARSVVLELFLGGADRADGDNGQCKLELRALHQELLDHAGALPRSEQDFDQMKSWLREWDKRFANTEPICAGLRSTRETLETLRKKLDAQRRDDARDLLPLTDRIERALSRGVPRSTPPRKT